VTVDTEGPSTLYARIPASLKVQLDAYASSRGETLTAAVTGLLARGLELATDLIAIEDMRARVATLERQLSQAQVDVAQAEATASALRSREDQFLTLARRAERALGPCPNAGCGKPVRGIDVLLTQQCPSCGGGLSSVLVGQTKGFNQTELLILLGALGILVGAAYVASKSGK